MALDQSVVFEALSKDRKCSLWYER